MKERGILFSAPLVVPVLADTKDVTRRIMSPQPEHLQHYEHRGELVYDGEHRMWCWKGHLYDNLIDFGDSNADRKQLAQLSPFGAPGDRLWVREAWRTVESLDELSPSQLLESVPVHYEADRAVRGVFREPTGRYRHARFMPRWASRITLEVVSIRVERLHEITEDDARREGVRGGSLTSDAEAFANLWCDINGEPSWAANPFVWRVEFKRIEQAARAA